MRTFLAIRLSAMGDVALTAPILEAALAAQPDLRIVLLTRAAFAPIFQGIERLELFAPDLKGQHKGLGGLFRLYRQLQKRYAFEGILDLHDVLRSRMLSFFFRLSGQKIYRIDKGRRAKKALTRRENKLRQQLPHSSQRYADVLQEAGLKAPFQQRPFLHYAAADLPKLPTGKKAVGIAPFAQHAQKRYPLSQMRQVLEALEAAPLHCYVFGGKAEAAAAEKLCAGLPHCSILIGQLALQQELAFIGQLDLMLCMDSANMHFARLVGTPVLSIWGATHPQLGFGPLRQDEPKGILQIPIEELPCRPCSVFGNKDCHRGDLACLRRIQPLAVAERVLELLAILDT